MNDQNASSSTRVSAAKAVAEIAFRAVEFEDFEIRLTILEEHLRERK